MPHKTGQPNNILYYGDNLDILKRYIRDESVDLIYLDPPFKSNQDYNVLFAEQNGSRSKAQLKAFEDTWEWNPDSARVYQELVESAPEKLSKAMQAFWTFLGRSDMMAYLTMMAPRLLELRRVLKPTGSIYLHCDPTASHYLKMLMDAVFSPNNFINEIIWNYISGGVSKKTFARKHDTIFLYVKNIENYNFTVLKERKEKFQDIDESKCLEDEKGKFVWYIRPDTNPNVPQGVKTYIDGFVQDVWRIPIVNPQAKERLGYPTQKPEALLERIIQASSNEGDTVLDPFCGCGTTIAVAQRLNRRWIGIDITHLAITLVRHRLQTTFAEKVIENKEVRTPVEYQVIGEPVSIPDAEALARNDRYQFQWWALGLVGARPADQKKGADKGIDGRLYFHDEPEGGKTKQVIFSVKSGKSAVSHVRDLRGVLEREKAEIGVLICMSKPTKAMRTEAASAGFYESPWGNHPRIQIFTIADLLKGKKIDIPTSGDLRTFKKAPKSKPKKRVHPKLPLL